MPTLTPTHTPTPTPTSRGARSSGSSYVAAPTATPTPEPTFTPTPTYTSTPTPSATPTPAYTPTPTPSATPTPTSTITPTPVFVILNVAPVVVEESSSEVVEIIHPNAEGRIVSPDGSVSVLFPLLSRRQTFQVGVSTDQKHCLSGPGHSGVILSCVRVDTFDEFGRAEEDAVLTSPARLSISLDMESDSPYEDTSALIRAYGVGGIRLVFREYLGEEWSEIPYSLSWISDGRAVMSAMRHRFGVFALIADVEVLTRVMAQEEETVATPTVTPLPTPVAEVSDPTQERTGSAWGLLIAILSPYLVALWFIRMIWLGG